MNKVLLISHMPPPTTGIGSWTRRVLESGLKNWDVGFINSNMIGGRDPFNNKRISLVTEIKRSFIIWRKEVNELKKDKSYLLVHTNIPCTLNGMVREFFTGMIAKRYGKKFIVHCHCTLPNVENTVIKKFAFKIFSFCVDGFIVLNGSSEEFVKKICKKPVEIIPNFVHESELPQKSEQHFNNRIQNVLFVGGVSPDKGCDTLIEAAALMPDIKFHLVGIISEEIKQMKKTPNVILYGNKDKEFVRDIMLSADIFIFLSRFYGEGFSVALVEAMAAGLPCIVTDWAANKDMVSPNGGIVISQKSPHELVEAINYYNSNIELRVKASKFNISKVRNSYVDTIVLDKITEFYNSIY